MINENNELLDVLTDIRQHYWQVFFHFIPTKEIGEIIPSMQECCLISELLLFWNQVLIWMADKLSLDANSVRSTTVK